MKQRRLPYSDYRFSEGIIINNNIYFFSEKENFLMEVDMESWKLKYSDKFVGYDLYYEGWTQSLKRIDDNICKLTLDGKYVELFFLKNNKYKKIFVGNYEKLCGNFVAFEVNRKNVYIFPKWENEVIIIDTIKCKKRVLTIPTKEEFVCFTTAFRVENKIWLFEADNHQVDVYDIETNRFTSYHMADEIENCIAVCWNQGSFFLVTSCNCIYRWNIYSGKSKLLWKEKRYFGIENYFFNITFVQNKLILLPSLGEDIVIVDVNNGKGLRYTDYPNDFLYYSKGGSKYSDCFENNDDIYFPMRMSNYILRINKMNGEIDWQKMIMPLGDEKIEFLSNAKLIAQDDLRSLISYLKLKIQKVENNLKPIKLNNNIWQKLNEKNS